MAIVEIVIFAGNGRLFLLKLGVALLISGKRAYVDARNGDNGMASLSAGVLHRAAPASSNR